MRRPKIKFRRRPVRVGTGLVLIGGGVQGANAVVPDSDGWVWALLEALDGSRTLDQLVTHMVDLFPDKPGPLVRKAVDQLVVSGFIENADEVVPDELTETELVRCSRSRALYSWMDNVPRRTSWDVQVLLQQARVVVIGLGGVGCRAVLDLTVSGVGHLHCVDRDVVELSDLNRQVLYTEQDQGEPKAEAAVRRLRERNSNVRITGESLSIDGPANLQALATGFDVLLLAADRPDEIRSWANRACRETDTKWVHAGYHGPLVRVGLYLPETGPCYDCLRAEQQAGQAAMPPLTMWSHGVGVTGPQAATATTAGFAGGLAALAVISLITGIPAVRTNCQFGYNLLTLQDTEVLTLDAPSPLCPVCRTPN